VEVHEFEERVTCQNCGNDEAGCVCEEDEQELEDQGICDVCEEYEDHSNHGEDDE